MKTTNAVIKPENAEIKQSRTGNGCGATGWKTTGDCKSTWPRAAARPIALTLPLKKGGIPTHPPLKRKTPT
jgi:hypothetical protein